jgi:hypothetical protein
MEDEDSVSEVPEWRVIGQYHTEMERSQCSSLCTWPSKIARPATAGLLSRTSSLPGVLWYAVLQILAKRMVSANFTHAASADLQKAVFSYF